MKRYDRDLDTYVHWSQSDNLFRLLEWPVFLETLGPVRGLNVLDLACGDGRLSRGLMEMGAASVVGTDISPEMIDRARTRNDARSDGPCYDHLRYEIVDAGDDDFELTPRADLVTAMYLFHYATSEDHLDRMCRHIGRNLKPGGRFVTVTINPDFDFANQSPDMEEVFGFRYEIVAPPKHTLIFGGLEVDMWCWSKAAHERGLEAAGLHNIRWHPLELPNDRNDLQPQVQWYMDNPSCIVLSAEKPA